MTWRTKKAVEARNNFAKRLGFEGWEPKSDINKLMRDCITYHKLCEMSCNGCTREKLPFESWDSYDKARDLQIQWIDKRLEVVSERIKSRAHSLGLWTSLQGDPRGCTARFKPFKLGTLERDKWGHVQDNSLIGADVWNW